MEVLLMNRINVVVSKISVSILHFHCLRHKKKNVDYIVMKEI